MPDSRESTSRSPTQKTTARATGSAPDRSRTINSSAAADVAETQHALRAAVTELQAVDRRLAGLAERLPAPGSSAESSMGSGIESHGPQRSAASEGARGEAGCSVALIELRGTIDCVRTDLLADAIDTLEAAGNVTEEELRRRFAQRRQVLIL